MILKLLERFGRKSVLVDFYGRVRMERYHLFYYEDEAKPRWWYWFPNAWLHFFPGPDSPDGEDQHRHPFSTVSIMLRGGYSEIVNGDRRAHYAPSLVCLWWHDLHRIESVLSGSWSLFVHGWRRGRWTFESVHCAEPCRACLELNGGACFKPERELPYNEQFARGDQAVRWERVNKDTERKLEIRRQAIARRGIVPPVGRADNKYAITKAIIEGERR